MINFKFFIIASALAAVLLAACSAIPPPNRAADFKNKIHGHADVSKNEIAPAALYEKLQNGEKLVVLDVREQNEFEEAHIPGTTHRISVKEISGERLKAAGIGKNDEIIVYCRSGARSRVAAQKMRELGYTNVWEMNSGIIHWMEDGLPTESGSSLAAPQTPTATQNETENAPKISFDRESHDFGEVKQLGGLVETSFAVRNEGKSDLKIGTITTSCSCTTAKIEQTKIAPGGQTVLRVSFNPNLHEEPQEKFKRTIFIPTNDPAQPEAELTIWVDILEGR